MKNQAFVIIPNFNGADFIADCLRSLEQQSIPLNIVVVENGSSDGSVELIESKFPKVTLLQQPKNLGFAGGVNVGIRHALENGAEFILLLNNDSVAEENWAEKLITALKQQPKLGIATSKMIANTHPAHIDSTGEQYSTWGLAFPRGRNSTDLDKYDDAKVSIFGASGGASAYRADMFTEIGLFDEDFFAYYEDVDLSFRAQLAGWKVAYVPSAVVHHQIGATAKKMRGFSTYQAFKNQPWVILKNLPFALWLSVWPRFALAYVFFMLSAIVKGKGLYALRGWLASVLFIPKKLVQRISIQRGRKVTASQLNSLLYKGLPSDYKNLHKLVYFYRRWL